MKAAVLAVVVLALARVSTASVVFTGTAYTQNFDSLNNVSNAWANDSTISGFYYYASLAATPTPNTYGYQKGDSAAQNAIASYGVLGTNAITDRTFGTQTRATGTEAGVIYYGLQLANSSGVTQTKFSVGYAAEVWRVPTNLGDQDRLTVQYQLFNAGAGSINAASGWIELSAANFSTASLLAGAGLPTNPTGGTGGTAVDGNSTSYRSLVSPVTATGISWGIGQELWVRWVDQQNNGAGTPLATNAGMGIDDVIVFTPEPTGVASAGLGFAAMLLRRRRRAA